MARRDDRQERRTFCAQPLMGGEHRSLFARMRGRRRDHDAGVDDRL